MNKSALLLIDIQRDFCKDGALEVKDSDSIIPIVNSLINYFKAKNCKIIATKDWHPLPHKSFAINSCKDIGDIGELQGLRQVFWPIHCVQNTLGSEFHKDLLPVETTVYKGQNPLIDSYSAFFDNGKLNKTNLDDILQSEKIQSLFIVGLATDYCVKYSVLDALDLGYEVFVVEDCIKGVDISINDSSDAIKEMKEKGAKFIKSSEVFCEKI